MSKKIKAFKGFDNNFQCRGYQYDIGRTEKHKGDIKLCGSGFHACESPLDVFGYYEPSNSKYAEVELSGETIQGDDKTVCSELTVKAEISIPGLVKAHIDWVLSNVKKTKAKDKDQSAASNTGYRSAASNTGDRSAASNTGYQSAASNTGDQSAASNTGDQSAASNTGNQSAASNTGNRSAASNTGNQSAASNTGYRSAASNTGDRSAASNTGYRSAASNTGNRSAASVGGSESVAIVTGYDSKAKASVGSWIVLTERNDDFEIVAIKTAKAGNEIKPDVYYKLVNGKFLEAE